MCSISDIGRNIRLNNSLLRVIVFLDKFSVEGPVNLLFICN